MFARLARRWAALSLVAAAALPFAAHSAALPPVVDGQPLPSLAPMLEKVTPAVVNISTKTRVQVRDPFFEDPVFRQFFGLQGSPRERVEQSLGSGVIVDAAKGYVLTNNHVVGGADDITVTLQDGRDVKGKLVGTDPETDLAVVQIQATGLAALPLADSGKRWPQRRIDDRRTGRAAAGAGRSKPDRTRHSQSRDQCAACDAERRQTDDRDRK